MALHDFATQLLASQALQLRAALESVYREFWPGCVIAQITHDDTPAFQRAGRDVAIVLRTPQGGTTLRTVEEKIRTPERSGYGDLLIEYLSNREQGTAGWIYTSKADWLAYVLQPNGLVEVHMLPMRALRQWFEARWRTFPDLRPAATTRVGGARYTTENKIVALTNPDFEAWRRVNGYARLVRWLSDFAAVELEKNL